MFYTGSKRIAEVAAKFDGMLRQVQLGMDELMNRKLENTVKIGELMSENETIDQDYDGAVKLRDALKQFSMGN